MSFNNAYHAELQLHTLMHRGRWEQALTAIDEWLAADPWRAELLLRKAHLFRILGRYEKGLAAVRAYRKLKPEAENIVFLEIQFLLDMKRTDEALAVLDRLPASQRDTAQASYHRGHILLANNEIAEGLQQLWTAYQREPGFNPPLIEWAYVTTSYYGKWITRRELLRMLAANKENPIILTSVGLALKMVDSRYGQRLLRRANERYTDITPAKNRHFQRQQTAPEEGQGNIRPSDGDSIVSEQLLAGHYESGIAEYYRVVSEDPSWMSVLAPLVAEVLVDELVRPEEARVLLEDALRREPTDYRLHLSYTKVFLKLGFGEEALSSANCAYSLAPDTEKSIALIQRAEAHLLMGDREAALENLRQAISYMPEARDLISQEIILQSLKKDRRFRDLMAGKISQPSMWERLLRWLVGS